MRFDDVLLKKEEIPIARNGYFMAPIHPTLLVNKIDRQIAHDVFPAAAQEWYVDLQEFVKTPGDQDLKAWIKSCHLKKKISVKDKGYEKIVEPILYRDNVITNEMGFATGLSISRNHGGSLYMNPDGHLELIHQGVCKFSEEKFREYNSRASGHRPETFCAHAHVYSQHNVDDYPGGLFLRNWAILYLNEALRSLI